MFCEIDLSKFSFGDTDHLFPRNSRPQNHVSIPYVKRQLKQFRQRGEEYLKEDIPLLSYCAFHEYWKSGQRSPYEQPYFNRRWRLTVFSILAWAYPEESQWLDALNEVVWQICSEPFWTVPPHFFGYYHEDIPFSMYHNHLDLCSTDTAYALTEVSALLGNRLPEMIREQIRINVRKRVIDTWLDDSRGFFFEHFPNNWASVCASCAGGAALQTLPDGEELRKVLHRCLKCMDVYLSSFGNDGVCMEGAGYFSYGFGMFTCFAQLLLERTGGQLDLFVLEPKLAKIAQAQAWYYISGKQLINFSDCSDSAKCYLSISQYLAQKTGAAVPPAARDILDDVGDKYCISLRDILWTQTVADCARLSGTKWFEDAQWYVSGGKRLAFAAKGGQNGSGGHIGYEGYEQYSHGHNDCGSFILYADGISCISDLGGQKYTADYFSEKRYEFLATSSRSHNVPIVNGMFQQVGKNCRAENIQIETDGEHPFFQLDIGGCYGGKENGVEHLSRRFEHYRGEDVLLLCDRLELTSPGTLCENFYCGGQIELTREGAVFSREQHLILLKFDAEKYEPSIVTETYDNGQITTAYFLRLTSKEKSKIQVFHGSFTIIRNDSR